MNRLVRYVSLISLAIALMPGTISRAGQSFTFDASVLKDVGKLGEVQGSSLPFVIVIEEAHNIRTIQVEEAIMLNRLSVQHGIRDILREGYAYDAGPRLNTNWFTRFKHLGTRQLVALNELTRGEISSVDFMAMINVDIMIHPTEKMALYNVTITSQEQGSPLVYLEAIKKFDPKWAEDTENRLKNAFNDPEKSVGNILEEIKLKAKSVKAGIDPQTTTFFEGLMVYYQAVDDRSEIIANQAAKIAKNSPKPVVLVIGARHKNDVIKYLKKAYVSYAVVIPDSFDSKSIKSLIAPITFDRRGKKSIDQIGEMGSLFDGRWNGERNPSSNLPLEWFQDLSATQYILNMVADWAVSVPKPGSSSDGSKPPPPPPPSALPSPEWFDIPPNSRVDVNPKSIEILTNTPKEISVLVELKYKGRSLWARVFLDRTSAVKSNLDGILLEKALLEALGELKNLEIMSDNPTPTEKPKPKKASVRKGVKAALSFDAAQLRNMG